MFGGGMLLANKSVQEELKLTKSQKDELAKIQKITFGAWGKAKEAKDDGDDDKAKEIMETARKDADKANKKFKESLSKTQVKRLGQIELQQAGFAGLQKAEVQKALKLSDKQKDEIKDSAKELEQDVAELFKDINFRDREAFAKARTKADKLRKETFAKVNKSFSDDQKKAWKEMLGEPFEIKWDFGGGFGKDKGKGKGKDRKKKSKDDI
jgi:hypothetical protein